MDVQIQYGPEANTSRQAHVGHAATGSDHPSGMEALEALDIASRRLWQLTLLPDGQPTATFHKAISLVHAICDALVACENAGVSATEILRSAEPARRAHAASPFIRRLQDWPRGYPGDFETIDWLCGGENRALDPVGRAFEHYALTASIAQQHRNKVSFQAACVLEALQRHSPCRVLSLACGSSPDIRSVARYASAGQSTFVLCDSDADALAFSAQHLAPILDRCRFVQGAVPRVLRSLRSMGPFHLVYAGGLFDYLPDRVVERTLAMIWRSLLAPGGRVVFTNIARGNPYRVWLEYIATWPLIERSEEDVERLVRMAGIDQPIELSRDPTGLAILASVRAAE